MSNLYGTRKRAKSPQSTPSASTLAFTTTLSSLIAKDSEPGSGTGSGSSSARPRPRKGDKSDLFARPNRGAQKRAAADLEDEHGYARQTHQRTADVGAVDAATLHRSKRRMEEKARMYDDLQRGMYLAAGSSDEDDDDRETDKDGGDAYLARLRRREREGLVDFDRKWADRDDDDDDDEHDEDGEDEADDNASIISYEDELGRSRRGTRAEAARAARQKAQEQEEQGRGPKAERWKPSRPENLIYGATVQTEAFQGSTAMAELAARRDRTPTPPPEMHYDAEAEVRNRGTGFYAFSKDEGERRRQMEALGSVREETQREREARRERRGQRERAREERRGKIEELRARRRAEMFLAGLGEPLGV